MRGAELQGDSTTWGTTGGQSSQQRACLKDLGHMAELTGPGAPFEGRQRAGHLGIGLNLYNSVLRRWLKSIAVVFNPACPVVLSGDLLKRSNA